MRVLLIGFGNPLRRDDGVGYRAALELENQGYAALALTQPLPELALALAEAEEVIFLDADGSLPPGTIGLRKAQPIAANQSNHAFAPEELLALAMFLFEHQPNVRVLSLGVEDLGFGEGFSPKVQVAFPEYVRQARSMVEELCTN